MKSFINYLQEMALKGFDLVPPHDENDPKSPWSPNTKRKYGWDVSDRKILTNPSLFKKFTKLWDNTSHHFYFILVKSPEASKFKEIGKVTPEWVRENIPQLANYEPKEDGINVIFTNNTGAEKIPFTTWTAAHRFGHSLARSNNSDWMYFTRTVQNSMQEMLNNYYNYKSKLRDRKTDKYLHKFAHSIGTMKSARLKKLRNFSEFYYELVAQYLTTSNKIQFKKDLEKMLFDRYVWGRPNDMIRLKDDEFIEKELENFADHCNALLDDLMNSLIGETFVM